MSIDPTKDSHAAWRRWLGSGLVGAIAATVSAALGYGVSSWQWWAVMGGCVMSGIFRVEIG